MKTDLTGQSKWGANNKMIFRPKWARWKLHLQISKERFREYYSYDYRYVWVNNEKLKLYQEELALIEMIERVREKNPTGYKFGNVFGNFTDDLSVDKKNYNHLVFSMTPEVCTWKQKIEYYKKEIPGSGYVHNRVSVRETLNLWEIKKAEQRADTEELGAKTEEQHQRVYRVLERWRATPTMSQQQAEAEIDRILQRR